jgi:6-phosphofructokinase
MIERARQASQSARKIGVVEVPGDHAGWLVLQAGMAAGAEAGPKLTTNASGCQSTYAEHLAYDLAQESDSTFLAKPFAESSRGACMPSLLLL